MFNIWVKGVNVPSLLILAHYNWFLGYKWLFCSPAVQDEADRWVTAGYLKKKGNEYRITTKGRAYLEGLFSESDKVNPW
jgi:hypothetical protein